MPNDYWINYDEGRILLSLGRKEESLPFFEAAVKINPNEFAAYIFSAGVLQDLGDYAASEARYNKVIELRPDYFYAYEGLGMLLMKRKEYKGARDAFIQAYAKDTAETSYALLAALNALRVQKLFEVKPFLEGVMKNAKRNSLDYYMLRLLTEFSGDANVARLIESEKDITQKSKMAFYLAEFYDITNKQTLANAYYEKCRETNRRGTIEWQLNEWKMEERNLLASK